MLSLIFQRLKKSRDSNHALSGTVIHRLGLAMINMQTAFEVTSLSRSRHILGTTPISGTVCHLYAGTCYDQPTYQIWSVYNLLLPVTK